MNIVLRNFKIPGIFNFSTDIASKNYLKFQTKYKEHMKAFQEKIDAIEKDNHKKQASKTTNQKAYSHPYNNPHNPIVFSAIKNKELFYDLVGPEQVSPHYENFAMSRKFLLTGWGVMIFLNLTSSTMDLQWMMKSSILPFLFYFQIMYFYLEGRHYFLKPMLHRFYRKIADHEINMFETFYHENIETSVRTLIHCAKNQLEYSELHSNYPAIKAEVINSFLANEQINLQKHIAERTINVLKSTKQFEEMNQRQILQSILDKALKSIDHSLLNNKKEIQDKVFQSALSGLSKGQMEYEGDPILPLVITSIQQEVSKIKNLTAAQQQKLVSLTTDQLELIRQQDIRTKNDFLQAEPKIDQGLKNQENVKRMLSKWGK